MAVELKTYGQQLAEIQEAIAAVNTAQRYELNGRQVQRADLEFLHRRERWLVEQLEAYGDIIPGSSVSRGAFKVSFE